MFAPAQHALPLKDIHLPPAPGIWPLAPGWWLALALLVFALIAGGRWWWGWHRRRARQRQLEQLFARCTDAAVTPTARLAMLSQLLRRAARVQLGESGGQLSGEQWLQWLDGDADDKPFSSGPGRLLLHGPFQRGAITQAELDALEPFVRQRFFALASAGPEHKGASAHDSGPAP